MCIEFNLKTRTDTHKKGKSNKSSMLNKANGSETNNSYFLRWPIILPILFGLLLNYYSATPKAVAKKKRVLSIQSKFIYKECFIIVQNNRLFLYFTTVLSFAVSFNRLWDTFLKQPWETAEWLTDFSKFLDYQPFASETVTPTY